MNYEHNIDSPTGELIPTEIKNGIDRWVQHGIKPGGFLQAVLANDLKESLGRADIESRCALFYIVGYLYNDCPGSCWGSQDKITAWETRHAEDRERAATLQGTQS